MTRRTPDSVKMNANELFTILNPPRECSHLEFNLLDVVIEKLHDHPKVVFKIVLTELP